MFRDQVQEAGSQTQNQRRVKGAATALYLCAVCGGSVCGRYRCVHGAAAGVASRVCGCGCGLFAQDLMDVSLLLWLKGWLQGAGVAPHSFGASLCRCSGGQSHHQWALLLLACEPGAWVDTVHLPLGLGKDNQYTASCWRRF